MLLSLSITTMAQSNMQKKEQPFRFLYLVHDPTSPVSTLIESLRKIERRARQYNQVCLIYLSNGRKVDEVPFFLAQINTEEDNRNEFDKILGELNNKLSHEINIQADISHILKIFDEHKIIDDNGDLLYKSVAMEFYLTSHFCENGYVDDFIVPLYVAFDVHNLPDKFKFYVMVNGVDREDPEYYFGNKNYNSINENVEIMKY